MKTIEELVNAGDPVDPDLVSILAAEGIDSVEDARALGREHFVDLFADRDGFTRDFDELLTNFGLTWETAASDERFLQCSPDDMEIGVPASLVIQKLGATTFAQVFEHPRDTVKRMMGERGGMLAELDGLLARHDAAW